MMIENIGPLSPLNPVSANKNTTAARPVRGGGDTITVSAAAKAQAEAYQLAQIAAETPDVRQALIDEVRARIQEPGYLNKAVLSSVTDKLMESYGL
jgi:hypothetical protein